MADVELTPVAPVARVVATVATVATVHIPRAEKPVIKLGCKLFRRKVVISCIVTCLSIFIGGCSLIYVYMGRNLSHWQRPANVFALFIIAYALSVVYRNTLWARDGFYGKIDEKPFDRIVPTGYFWYVIPAGAFYEIWNNNGKHYLWRLFVTEILESAYQVFNFRLYACFISSKYLLLYCSVMAAEGAFRIWRLWNASRPIDNAAKNAEVIADVFLELFCTVYPICVGYLILGVYFSDSEIIQLISFPVVAMGLKIELIWRTEIIVALDDVRISQKMMEFRPHEVKKRRRTSFALREENVARVQNETCTRRPRMFLLVTAMLFFVFYLSLAVAQLSNLFIKTPSHFQYCEFNVPACEYWFYGVNNCLSINYLAKAPPPMDAVLSKFRTNSATIKIHFAGLTDLRGTLGGAFHRLQRLEIFQTNATKFDIDLNQWQHLDSFHITGAPNISKAHKSLFQNDVRTLSYAFMPNLEIEHFNVPSARIFNMVGVGSSPLKTIHGPNIYVLQLNGFGFERLPKSLRNRKYSILKVANNNLTTLDGSAGSFVIDLRYNNMKEFPKTKIYYKYAYGNKYGCPKDWICDPFCDPLCGNYLHDAPTEEQEHYTCTSSCVLKCGLGTSRYCQTMFVHDTLA